MPRVHSLQAQASSGFAREDTLELASARQPDEKINVITSIPFALIHIAALGVFFVPFRWSYLAVCIGLYLFRMFGITAGYHRYFAHRTYKPSRVFQFLIALLGTTAAQKGPLWWAAHHRHHHRES